MHERVMYVRAVTILFFTNRMPKVVRKIVSGIKVGCLDKTDNTEVRILR